MSKLIQSRKAITLRLRKAKTEAEVERLQAILDSIDSEIKKEEIRQQKHIKELNEQEVERDQT